MRTVYWLVVGLGVVAATVIYFNVKTTNDTLAKGGENCATVVAALQSSVDQATRLTLKANLRECIRNRHVDYQDVA